MTNPFGYVTNERQIATELWELIRQFYALYPKYSKLDLYIVGESYGEPYERRREGKKIVSISNV